MTFMPWTDEMELGLPEIDRQHRWLVDRTNELHDELSQPAPRRELVGQVLEALVDYTHNHFIAEELLFQQHDYPDTPAHKAEHDGFCGKAMELLMRFEDGEEASVDAMALLKEWLTHHICHVDRAYVPFFRAHGLSRAGADCPAQPQRLAA